MTNTLISHNFIVHCTLFTVGNYVKLNICVGPIYLMSPSYIYIVGNTMACKIPQMMSECILSIFIEGRRIYDDYMTVLNPGVII